MHLRCHLHLSIIKLSMYYKSYQTSWSLPLTFSLLYSVYEIIKTLYWNVQNYVFCVLEHEIILISMFDITSILQDTTLQSNDLW